MSDDLDAVNSGSQIYLDGCHTKIMRGRVFIHAGGEWIASTKKVRTVQRAIIAAKKRSMKKNERGFQR